MARKGATFQSFRIACMVQVNMFTLWFSSGKDEWLGMSLWEGV